MNTFEIIFIFVAGIFSGVSIGAILGYMISLKIFYKGVIDSDTSVGVKNVARKLKGKPTKVQYMSKMTDDEAMKNEENSARRHSDLVVINKEDD